MFSLALLLVLIIGGQANSGTARQFTQAEVFSAPGGSLEPPPASPNIDVLATPWQTATLPYVFRQASPSPSDANPALDAPVQTYTTRWFRLRFKRPGGASPHLYVPRWQTIGKVAVYVDGQLAEFSRGGAVWNGYNHPLWVAIHPTVAAEHELLIRVVSVTAKGGALSTLWVGPASELGVRRMLREAVQAKLPEVSSAAFLVLGFFSLGVWLKRRLDSRPTDPIYLLFFISSLVFYLRTLHYYLGLEPLLIAEDWFGWVTVNSSGWVVLASYSFVFRLHRKRYPMLEYPLVGLMLLVAVATLPGLAGLGDIALLAPLVYLALFVVVVVLCTVMCWAAWQSRSREALAVSAWHLLAIPFMAHDLLLQQNLISSEAVYLSPFLAMGTSLFFLTILIGRYTQAIEGMEQSKAQLETRLRERELQLGETFAQLRQAEQQQVLAQERQRLIRDMHDGFGSSLISALAAVERGKFAQQDISRVLRECIDDLKLTIDSLEPLDADLRLLLASLRQRLGSRLEQSGVALRWVTEDELKLDWLTPGSALHILRILQEVFTNIIKHAQATHIELNASKQVGHVLLCISDNGKGFDRDMASGQGGRGLRNIQQRATAIGATADWQTHLGQTNFVLKLPSHGLQVVA